MQIIIIKRKKRKKRREKYPEKHFSEHVQHYEIIWKITDGNSQVKRTWKRGLNLNFRFYSTHKIMYVKSHGLYK